MNARDGSSYAFLVEIMAVILFFALAASVIVTLFVGADGRARESTVLSGAIIAASSAAEVVRASDSPEADFAARYGAVPVDGGYEAWLDASFEPGSFEQYILRLACHKDNGLYEMTVAVEEADGEVIYEIACANYIGGGA